MDLRSNEPAYWNLHAPRQDEQRGRLRVRGLL
jgi:hypothetical protein